MTYSQTEIELTHNRGYLQALKHVLGYIEQFPDITAVKRLTTGLMVGTETAITRLERDIESEHEAEYQASSGNEFAKWA